MEPSQKYDSFIFYIQLDMLVPLEDWKYILEKYDISKIIKVKQSINGRNRVGSLATQGVVFTSQQPKNGEGSGSTSIEFVYIPDYSMSIAEFGELLELSSIWHLSPTAWGFLAVEINRIIDLYRLEANAYWWNHVGMWNFDEVTIKGIKSGEDVESLIQTAFPKIIFGGNNPFQDFVSDTNSNYNKNIICNVNVPFYFVMYLNGRRSFSEYSFREALINWANCIEAYGIYLIFGVCKIANITIEETNLIIKNTEDDYIKRYSKVYEILAEINKFPSIKKRLAVKLIKEIMEYRLNSAVLMLTRYLIDDDYSKEFDEENNLKSQ